MKVFVDSDVILDFLIQREPFFEASRKVVELCSQHKADGYMAAHSVTNLFYLLRKDFSDEERRKVILNLFDIFVIDQINTDKLRTALENKDFKDFEDCLQVECALNVDADYIVTRNVNDYKGSPIHVVKPEDFCALFDHEVQLSADGRST